jgi:hypothetical protein
LFSAKEHCVHVLLGDFAKINPPFTGLEVESPIQGQNLLLFHHEKNADWARF